MPKNVDIDILNPSKGSANRYINTHKASMNNTSPKKMIIFHNTLKNDPVMCSWKLTIMCLSDSNTIFLKTSSVGRAIMAAAIAIALI